MTSPGFDALGCENPKSKSKTSPELPEGRWAILLLEDLAAVTLNTAFFARAFRKVVQSRPLMRAFGVTFRSSRASSGLSIASRTRVFALVIPAPLSTSARCSPTAPPMPVIAPQGPACDPKYAEYAILARSDIGRAVWAFWRL